MLRPGSSISYNSTMNKISIEPHPTDYSIIFRFDQPEYFTTKMKELYKHIRGTPNTQQTRGRAASANVEMKGHQKIVQLKDFSSSVDINSICKLVMNSCPFIPPSSKKQLEQVLFYLQKRGTVQRPMTGRSRSSSTVSFERRQPTPLAVDIAKLEEYIECFYSETHVEKNKGAMHIYELSKKPENLKQMIQNETLLGALARVFREDWKKSYDIATNIMLTFISISKFQVFHSTLLHHKIGSLCITTIEHETKRYDLWIADMKRSNEETIKRLKMAIKKQAGLVAACVTLLTNLAVDMNVEVKMVRRDLVPLLVKCLKISSNPPNQLTLATIRLMLKLSIFDENRILMEQNGTIERLLKLFPIDDDELRQAAIKLLFNFSFGSKNVSKMVEGGLVPQIAQVIDGNDQALNVLYILSCNDDAKAMLAYTDAIKLLMKDILNGTSTRMTKAVLLNACIEKRNAQLLCGTDGQGLDILMDMALKSKDLMIMKIIRAIGSHEGSSQTMFLKWMPHLLKIAMDEAPDTEDGQFGLECMGTVAEIKVAPWAQLMREHEMVPWIIGLLHIDSPDENDIINEMKPIQLQVVIACGTMAKQLDAAKALIPAIDTFLSLMHSTQTDDEFVIQLLYLFHQFLRHKELADRLMGRDSRLGSYIIDIMNDTNAAIREMCDNSLIILGEHSKDWAQRIAGERFKWHNEQWLNIIEKEGNGFSDEEDYGADLNFDYEDGFDLNERLF